MRRKLCAFLLRLLGWKYELAVALPEKCVFCVAPHTSNWDLFLGELLYFAVGGKRKVSFLIKKEWFFFPLNFIFKKLGGVPVDRSKKTSLVDQMISEFRQRDAFCLAVTPEGTRKANPNWKKGFYYIAKGAAVPLLLVYLDYSVRRAGVERIFEPTGDFDADITQIKQYYSNFKGRYPENFSI